MVAYDSINKFLRKNKILTPKLYYHDYNKGVMVIEDFGNLSFYKILSKQAVVELSTIKTSRATINQITATFAKIGVGRMTSLR